MLLLKLIGFLKDDETPTLIITVICISSVFLVFLLSIPTVLFNGPTGNIQDVEVEFQQYLDISSALNISYSHLISYDTARLDNDFNKNKIKEHDIVESALRFVNLTIKEYEWEERIIKKPPKKKQPSSNGKNKKKPKEPEPETTIEIVKVLGATHKINSINNMVYVFNRYYHARRSQHNFKVANVVRLLKDMSKNDMWEISYTYINFNNVMRTLSKTQQKYAQDLLMSGVFESEEFNMNLYDSNAIVNLKEYPIGTAYLPYYSQLDKKWAYANYGSSTILAAGCGPTSLAMVASGLLKDSTITPLTIANFSVANGYRCEGAGSYWSLMLKGARQLGLQSEAVFRKDKNRVISALEKNMPVIACMGPGHFTKSGHFIVLIGLNADGTVNVYDSASYIRTNKSWSLDLIVREASRNAPQPFWIIRD